MPLELAHVNLLLLRVDKLMQLNSLLFLIDQLVLHVERVSQLVNQHLMLNHLNQLPVPIKHN